jgi:hypothetical protein
MFQFTYKLKITERVKAKCERHPRYNPERDGRGGIRGGCSTCFSPFDLHQARLALEAAQREFSQTSRPMVPRLSGARQGADNNAGAVSAVACRDSSRGAAFAARLSLRARGPVPSPASPSLWLKNPRERSAPMDWIQSSVANILAAVDAPLYDLGVLSPRGMLPGLNNIPAASVLDRLSRLKRHNQRGAHIYFRPSGEHRFTILDDLDQLALTRLSADGFDPCAVVQTSPGNFQSWLKHASMLPKLLSTFAAQTLARRYHADLSAADWHRFGRLPGFTHRKPKHRRPDGRFPFVQLRSHTGHQYPMAEAFHHEITALYQVREKQREARRLALASPHGARLPAPSLQHFRTSTRYQNRPAAADFAFCLAAFRSGMTEDQIERALEHNYLSRDPSPPRRAAYIRRTMAEARDSAPRVGNSQC